DGFIVDGVDLADSRVFCRHRRFDRRHGPVGKIQPRRQSATRCVRHRYHARRSAFYILAWNRFHPSWLAGFFRYAPMGRRGAGNRLVRVCFQESL
ncbi:MAG: Glycerol transport-related protein GlpU, partial [Olavius algarvensis Gamma 3 endosymbiont]